VPAVLTRNWYMAMDASTATFRPVKESRSTSFMQLGASSDRSLVSPCIPMLKLLLSLGKYGRHDERVDEVAVRQNSQN